MNQGDINHVTGEVHFLNYLLSSQKTILTILDCVMMESLWGFKRWFFWFFWLWLPEKKCVAITVISECTRKQVIKYLNCHPDKVRVIYASVSDEFIASPKIFNQECPRLLQVGTFPNKNILRTINALEGLKCHLTIVGRLNEEHKNLLCKLNIDYINLIDISRHDLLRQYQLCDILLFASTYEGFGLPIVEANAIGRPVITSNLWSMPEVGASAACYVDPYDIFSIRSAIKKVINDESYRTLLVANGIENAKRFSVDRIAKQYASLYQEVYLNSQKR
jgi:glycosyltransferase involved in cell wall biosynthesis